MFYFFNYFSSFLLPVVQKFSQKWKIAIFPGFFHVFIIFHHFCFQWCKKNPKNGKLQFSSFFHFFIIFHFFSFFIIFASSGGKIFPKMENCNFPRFFSCFYHFSSFLLPVVQKNPKNGKLQFSSFFHVFIIFHFFSFFIIFASVVQKWWNMLKKR